MIGNYSSKGSKMRVALSLAGLLMLTACGAFDQFAEAKEVAAQNMKDPASVQFRNLRHCPESREIVVGERNGKNSFGAYEGFEDFWVKRRQVYTVGSSSNDEFIALMAECVGMTVDEFPSGMRAGMR